MRIRFVLLSIILGAPSFRAGAVHSPGVFQRKYVRVFSSNPPNQRL